MFRTVYITRSSKIKTIQGYLLIFDGDDEKRIYLDEVSQIIIENKNSLITVPSLLELTKRNISVIFCDEQHNPFSTILSFNSHYAASGNIFNQLEWDKQAKESLWQQIVISKIKNQIKVLKLFSKSKSDILEVYLNEIKGFDETNREGLAAKVYFFELFGHEFQRERTNTDCLINKLLNYGYSIILSCFNREIIACGYLTQLGIFHRGKQNYFNLSCDFMEPFRPIVDALVKLHIDSKDPIKNIRKVLTYKIILNNEQRYIDDAIRVYVQIMFRILKKDSVLFPTISFLLEDFKDDKSNETNNNV